MWYLSQSWCCLLCVVIGIELCCSVLILTILVALKMLLMWKCGWWLSHSTFTFFIFIAVSVHCIFYFYYLAQTGTCYRYCDTCCKVIATCSCEVGWVDEIVCTIRVRWYTGSISVEVTANYNPGHVWPCSSVILILCHGWNLFVHTNHKYRLPFETEDATVRAQTTLFSIFIIKC